MPNYSRLLKNRREERRRKNIYFSIVAVFVLIYISATWYSANKTEGFEFIDFFAADANVEVVVTDTGLSYQDLIVGDGDTAQAGQIVVVHYTGWLTDETQFDSSVDRNSPFEFPLGEGRVIQGWDEGVSGMQVGGVRLLMIPAGLAYGERGSGALIPGGATLIFQVELLEVKTVE